MLLPVLNPPPRPAPTLAEQVVAAELAYYRQLEQEVVTAVDLTTWHHKQALLPTKQAAPVGYAFHAFARHVLERRHQSLHHYMARHLSVEAWVYWFRHRGLVDSSW
jgi:hypothetical protein